MALVVGIGLAVAALAIYLTTRTERFYDHFVWQAAAFLEGQAAIRYPVLGSGGVDRERLLPGRPAHRDDATVCARGLLPFPPLPAVLLLPFVAVWGLATDDQRLFTLLAAIDVAICWWMLGRLDIRLAIRAATTAFFAFGTVFWYSAQLATTWYQAHIVAVGLTMLACGLAIGADPLGRRGRCGGRGRRRRPTPATRRTDPCSRSIDASCWPGSCSGSPATARIPILVAAPFLLLVGRRAAAPGGGAGRPAIGAAIPVGLLLAYNLVSSGQLIQPAYDYLYRVETAGYPTLGYHADWAIEDPRYLPQNLGIMLLRPPDILPDRLPDALGYYDTPVCTEPGATRGLFDVTCPLAVPSDVGMSLLLTSPAFLLALAVIGRFGRSRLVTGAVLAIVAGRPR